VGRFQLVRAWTATRALAFEALRACSVGGYTSFGQPTALLFVPSSSQETKIPALRPEPLVPPVSTEKYVAPNPNRIPP